MKNGNFKVTNAWICQIKGEKVKPIFGDLQIAKGKIEKIERKRFNDFVAGKISKEEGAYDAEGAVVTIPAVNFHEHFYSRLAKGLNVTGSTENFYDILKNLWWKLDRALTLDAVKASAQMGAIESVKSGVTYVFDHHASPNAIDGSLAVIADTLENFGLRGAVCFEGSDRNGKEISEKSLSENAEFAAERANANVKAMLGLHASFTVGDETLRKAKEIQDEYGLGVHIHLCEDELDRTMSKEIAGAYPVKRLKNFGLLNEKGILAHGIYLTKREYDAIAESGAALAFNPDSNLNNSVGLPDYFKLNENIPLLMGTDGMHANPLRSFKNVFLLMRAAGFSFEEAFYFVDKIYFDQLAFVRRYFPDFPSLVTGDRADFVVWDYVPPTPFNADNFFGHFIYGMIERTPKAVVQNGKFLLKDKTLVNVDENEINKNIFKQGKKLKRRFEII
jgi:cytosine/adenosine deaminase-related metal-dependent hydrolase